MLNPYIEAHELRDLVLKKEIKPREVAEFFIARVQKLNPKLGRVHDYHAGARAG